METNVALALLLLMLFAGIFSLNRFLRAGRMDEARVLRFARLQVLRGVVRFQMEQERLRDRKEALRSDLREIDRAADRLERALTGRKG